MHSLFGVGVGPTSSSRAAKDHRAEADSMRCTKSDTSRCTTDCVPGDKVQEVLNHRFALGLSSSSRHFRSRVPSSRSVASPHRTGRDVEGSPITLATCRRSRHHLARFVPQGKRVQLNKRGGVWLQEPAEPSHEWPGSSFRSGSAHLRERFSPLSLIADQLAVPERICDALIYADGPATLLLNFARHRDEMADFTIQL